MTFSPFGPVDARGGTASRCLYEVTVTVDGDELRYESITTIEHARLDERLQHTDRNVLHRVEQ
jgi:hypothetical protein